MALLDRFERFLDQVIPPPDEVAAAVRRGEALLDADDAEGALRIADDALSITPGYLRALLLHADALAALGRHGEALAALDAAHRTRSLPADALARMVELASRVDEPWRTLELDTLTRARLRGRDASVARRLLAGARHLLARGHDTVGLRLARSASLADPTLAGAWLLLGHDALHRGDRALARRNLDRALAALAPTDAEGNRLAGEIAWGLGQREAAARCLRRAWITGDDGAIATLVAVLAAGDDSDSLTRVIADARGELGDVARGLLGLARHGTVTPELERARGAAVPAVLWHYALGVALRASPALARRWCDEATERPSSGAVRALFEARDALDAGDVRRAVTALDAPLADPTTRPFARDTLRDAWRRAWRSRLSPMLEGLAAVAASTPRVDPSLDAGLRALRRGLDEPLRVVLLGEFSAGKSTFLNALVGAEVSPTGVLPTTAHVHWLRHGEPGARVFDPSGGVVEASLDEAPRTVARRRASGAGVAYVEVTLPLPQLLRMEVIDTPGFNAGDPAHEEAVRRAFELADVGLWLFDARQAGRHSELAPLGEARAQGLPVLGLLNKIDQVPEASRQELLEFVRQGFEALAPCVLAVSARRAFEAARMVEGEARDAQLDLSGWTSLRRYLDQHLVAQQAAWKHARAAHAAAALIDAARARLDADDAREDARLRACGVLGEAVVALRESLSKSGAALRREVELALRDQLRSIDGARGEERAALVADTVAEVGWRARERTLRAIHEPLSTVERLAVQVGVCSEAGRATLRAPVIQWLDHLVAEGVRDATSLAVVGDVGGAPGFLASDPLAALEDAVDEAGRAVHAPNDALRLALEVAGEVVGEFHPPVLPIPTWEAAVGGHGGGAAGL